MPSERPIGSARDPGPPADAADAARKAESARHSAEQDPPLTPLIEASTPSVLGVARLSRRPYLSDAAEGLYRSIARTVELGPGQEFVLAPCGRGVTTQFLASVSGADGAGIDPDPAMVEAAQERARDANMLAALHFDEAPLTDLPYQDDVFDFAMGEIAIGASRDPARAVAELVRVTKPMGTIMLLQLVWTRQLEPMQRDALVRQLGVKPVLLVEWKQMLRDAGVVELHVDDLTDDAVAPREPLLGVAGLADFIHLRDRMGVAYRAWQRWGWLGAWESILNGTEVRNLIQKERVLGLSLVRGTKWRPGDASRNRNDSGEDVAT